MAFIEKQKHGNLTYYYIVKSIRTPDGKVKKIRKFIGRKLPTHNELQQHFQEVELQAAKAFPAKWLTGELFEKVEDIRNAIKVLKRTPIESLPKDFLVRFTYNTNAIEGNRMTLRQTALVLDDNITPQGVRTEDFIEVINSKDAWDFVKGFKSPANEKFIKKIQFEVTKNTSCRIQGDYRNSEVGISGSDWKPPKASTLPQLMREFVLDIKREKKELHPIELAALSHNKLVQIHPFTDGNGRTARLIINWQLIRNGFPPVVIEAETKEEYYKAIEEGDKGKHSQFANFLAKEMVRQYSNH